MSLFLLKSLKADVVCCHANTSFLFCGINSEVFLSMSATAFEETMALLERWLTRGCISNDEHVGYVAQFHRPQHALSLPPGKHREIDVSMT